MKIVTYNVNGLRPRISQFGSLRKFLDSLDADIICIQETKLARHDLKSDLVCADGYESFVSCTRTSVKGRTGYSGVATFCRVESASSSNEVALPIHAEEGFTGLLENAKGFGTKKDEIPTVVEGLEGFSREELLEVDNEGRCIITDHGHFVLFNIYGPRAAADDADRIQFKSLFYKILKRRWESLMLRGRRIFVVGDFNIAPSAIDRCEAGPEFENNEFRKWFRSILMEGGGSFIDVFRAKHPERREAYTCWSTSSGAEIFNYGSRIDHIITAGPCFHEKENIEGHDFLTCHVEECEILTQFKRWKPKNTSSNHKWKGGTSIKLEGSDHAPVCMTLMDIPNVEQHNTPPLSTRYCPQVQGFQQTLASVFLRRQSNLEVKTSGGSNSFTDEESTKQAAKRSIHACNTTDISSHEVFAASSSSQERDNLSKNDRCPQDSHNESSGTKILSSSSFHFKSEPKEVKKKKAKQNQGSQLSLRSFFQKTPKSDYDVSSSVSDVTLNGAISELSSDKTQVDVNGNITVRETESSTSQSNQLEDESNGCDSSGKEMKNVALLEWQRIQQLMQNSIPACKGHKEPCVVRIVKKAGPTFGRRFYVCARAEGPVSNPDANCGYFKWADSRSNQRGGVRLRLHISDPPLSIVDENFAVLSSNVMLLYNYKYYGPLGRQSACISPIIWPMIIPK